MKSYFAPRERFLLRDLIRLVNSPRLWLSFWKWPRVVKSANRLGTRKIQIGGQIQFIQKIMDTYRRGHFPQFTISKVIFYWWKVLFYLWSWSAELYWAILLKYWPFSMYNIHVVYVSYRIVKNIPETPRNIVILTGMVIHRTHSI